MEQEKNQPGAEQEQPPRVPSVSTSTEEQITSKEPRTYSEEEWNLRQSKLDEQASDAKRLADQASSQAGYWQTEHEALGKQLQELQAEIERKEDAALGDDAEALSAVKIRRQATKAKQESERKEKDVARRESALSVVLKEQAILELSHEYNVEPSVLKIANSREEAELIAKTIKQEREKVQKTSGEPPSFDRSVSDATGSRSFTRGQIAKMPYEEYQKNAQAIEKAYQEGRIK